MVELVVPHPRYHASFLDSHREWEGKQQDGTGLRVDDDVASAAGFTTWVKHLLDAETHVHSAGQLPCTYRWITHGEQYMGSILLRHRLTAALTHRGGHIGYGIRPSARGQGLASWALSEMLPIAHDRNLSRVLATCYEDNIGSWRTIEICGGVLEDVRTNEYGRHYRRYWLLT